MCSDLVELVVHETQTEEAAVAANLEDISPSGACVQVEEGVREGLEVEIVGSTFRLTGTVRYCRYSTIGYDVGISFDRLKAWQRQQFEPAHLLDLPSESDVGDE
jgi:hypothetical protein